MEVSLRNFWPRAERKLYEEPKKLVGHGLAEVSREMVGRRPRRVYRITADGRRALKDWLGAPGDLPVMEFEALVKVFFAEHGDKEQLLATLDHIIVGVEHRQRVDAQWAAYYLATGGRFPGRTPVVTLVGTLQAEINRTVEQWARWARTTAQTWPDELVQAPVPQDVLREIAGEVGHSGDKDAPPPGYGEK